MKVKYKLNFYRGNYRQLDRKDYFLLPLPAGINYRNVFVVDAKPTGKWRITSNKYIKNDFKMEFQFDIKYSVQKSEPIYEEVEYHYPYGFFFLKTRIVKEKKRVGLEDLDFNYELKNAWVNVDQVEYALIPEDSDYETKEYVC